MVQPVERGQNIKAMKGTVKKEARSPILRFPPIDSVFSKPFLKKSLPCEPPRVEVHPAPTHSLY